MTVPHLTPAVQASTAPAAFAAVRANGLRLSTARRLLLQALFDSDRPLSAEELAGDGDVASAYRNLEVLEGLGLVRHVHLGHGPGLYQPAGRPREFVLCESCGEASPLQPAAPRRACARRCSTRSATGPASPTSRSPACARPACRRTAHADAHPRRADARPSGRGPAAWPPRSSACTSSASGCSSGSSSRTTSASAPAAPSRPASASPPTRSGMRHAFDADHIAAIDNTTRKLMQRGPAAAQRRVLLLARALHGRLRARAAALRRRQGAGRARSRTTARRLHSVTGLIGTSVSGTFLYVIAALNLVVLVGIVRVFRDMRRGAYSEDELEDLLQSRGLMNRFLGRFTRAVRKPWQMYPLGILFGLGFDTATEVALLFLAAGAAGAGLPWYAILCLPVLFAAGHVAAGHDRRLVHELRLRLGVLQARAQGLLQHHDHGALGGRGAASSAPSSCSRSRPTKLSLRRRLLGLGGRDRPQRRRLHRRRRCSSRPGRSRSRSGASGASRSAGRCRARRPSARDAAAGVPAGQNGALCSASSTSTAPCCCRPPRRTRRRCSRRWRAVYGLTERPDGQLRRRGAPTSRSRASSRCSAASSAERFDAGRDDFRVGGLGGLRAPVPRRPQRPRRARDRRGARGARRARRRAPGVADRQPRADRPPQARPRRARALLRARPGRLRLRPRGPPRAARHRPRPRGRLPARRRR